MPQSRINCEIDPLKERCGSDRNTSYYTKVGIGAE